MGFSCEGKLDYDSEIEIIDRIKPKNIIPKIYLDDNQITVRCLEANFEEKGTVKRRRYTVVIEEKFRQMLANGEAVYYVCKSQVKKMSSLFKDNKSFDQDLSSWDTSNVTNMRRMFFNARSFNNDIGHWDT
jgi:surface protein